jgi:hypothetical protein
MKIKARRAAKQANKIIIIAAVDLKITFKVADARILLFNNEAVVRVENLCRLRVMSSCSE